MMEFYRGVYGETARIMVYKDGSARLTVRIGCGKLIHAKDYKSRRGARIAMGHLSDGWTKR